MKTPIPVLLLVCGNVHRCDDGAAIRATGQLLVRLPDGRAVRVHRCGQLDIHELLEVPIGQPVVIIDAAIGVPAGRVVTIPLDDLIDSPNGPVPHSSHALPINQLLGVANVLRVQPLRGLFVGIGGADFGYGDRLSPVVRRSLPRMVEAVLAAIEVLAPGRAGTGVVA